MFREPSRLLLGLCSIVQSSICFYFCIRETVVDYRTDPLSLSLATMVSLAISLGILGSLISAFERFRRSLALLHIPALGAAAVIALVGSYYVGAFILFMNGRNILSLWNRRLNNVTAKG